MDSVTIPKIRYDALLAVIEAVELLASRWEQNSARMSSGANSAADLRVALGKEEADA